MEESGLGCLATAIAAIILIPLYMFMAQAESDTFNRLCNGHTTAEDAMFAELRVDGSCKPAP